MESGSGKLKQESLLSNVFNYQSTMMKDHLHLPKDHNSLKRVIEEYYNETDPKIDSQNHMSTAVFSNETKGKEQDCEIMRKKPKSNFQHITTAPLLSNVFNQKLTRRLTPLSQLDQNTDRMKDKVRARKSPNTTTPLMPTTPGDHLRNSMIRSPLSPLSVNTLRGQPQQLSKDTIVAQKSRRKEAGFNPFASGSFPTSCKQTPFQVAKQPQRKGPPIQKKNHSTPKFNDPTISTPNYTNETRNKWKKAIVSDDSDASDQFSDNDFYDDGDDEFYEFQKHGGIGSNIEKGKQPIDIPPRTLDFNENERQGNTSDYQPDIDYSRVADMLSDQSDGDSEDEEVQPDVDYDDYELLKTTNNVVKEYATLGPPSVQCNKCHAWMWKEERVRTDEAITPRLGGRLYQQYVVDAFSTIEQARLWWFRTNQSTLRSELYTNIQQSLTEGTSDTSNLGKGFILPAGFVGSRRYMQQNFQDALAVCRYIGHPDIFLTMTTNPVWDEVIEMMKLLPRCSPQNSPDVMARVFRLKLDQLIDDIKKRNYFGTCLGVMYVVEFQKRGLPHVHMLICTTVPDIFPKSTVQPPFLIRNPHLILNEKQQQYYALAEIHTLLKSIGKSLKDYTQMPQPPYSYLDCSVNNLIIEETSYDTGEMEKEYATLISSCNTEQMEIYNAVMKSVEKKEGGVFFVYGSGGCGKTYLWRTLISKLRSQRLIVLPVASSGIAATLMPGGRTAHSRFKIPIVIDEYSMCSISHTSDIAELIKRTSLIIWDEAPMQHRYAFECLDRSLRDIMKAVDQKRFHMPFGGISIVFGGDFRQILPVIARGSRSEIVAANITRSRLWKITTVYKLLHNMRLNRGNSPAEVKSLAEFAQWVLDIGDGKIASHVDSTHEYHEDDISITPNFCNLESQNSVEKMIESTFPNFMQNFQNPDYLSERAILTPTNLTVGNVNSLIVERIPGDIASYFSIDTAEDYPGVVVMLMRNLNQTLGLCNGTRMMVTKCMQHCVECEVIAGQFKGTKHFIPRMELCPTETRLPFKLCRKQMPIQICYAMTINKAQGQSLEKVALFLPKGVFTHGQLYVAVSRITSPQGLKLFIDDEDGNSTNITQNVVYKEVFYNLPVI
ncbi:hypothetical protein POM88_051020 [Heracleum sosnowskyi]|uniref:ATP-dependent DNA helicase n=1 Tax=Heracleum sosnowskyi TaxID=360622 RepID=A0AAD8H0Z4_9APIA|nr:hypothetical protein POM88_051020 [Heracleum sosnowskyi]